MRILIVNDDGIEAEGIRVLAELGKELGEVYVVAPKEQCSAMSHRITIQGNLSVLKEKFPVDGVEAYSVTGTPADCVKVAVSTILPWRPDIVFSGINEGYNVGADIMYSGTVAAAMEALILGIPAIAFSHYYHDDYEIAKHYLVDITKKLMSQSISVNEIWNVNFPNVTVEECKGIRENCMVDSNVFFTNTYKVTEENENQRILSIGGIREEATVNGSDKEAVSHGYIAIGKVHRA